jgi:hypothetical protein
MQERFKYTDRMVISFVVLGILLLIGFSALVLIKNKTLTDRTYYQTVLDNASGLSSKPPIYFKGFEIGRIDDFELESETNNILVRFYIYENYTDKIVKYAVISRIESLILGTGSQYEILLPRQGLIARPEPLREGALIPFITSELGQAYAKEGQITVKADSIESVLTSANNLLINLQKESDSEAGEIFIMVNKISQIADSFLVMAQQAEDGQLVSEVKNTIKDLQAVIDTSSDTVENASKITDSILAVVQQVEADQLGPEIKKTVIALQVLIATTDSTILKADNAISNVNAFLENADEIAMHANNMIGKYEDPADIINRVTNNKLPEVIDKVDVNLIYLQGILKEVHSQREQLAIAIVSFNKTLSALDKTLEGFNNNPLLKDGIEPENKVGTSIEVNEN